MFSFVRILTCLTLALCLSACDSTAVIGSHTIAPDPVLTDNPAPLSDAPVSSVATPPQPAAPAVAPDVVTQAPDPAPAPAPVTPRTYSAADITDLILVTGQSNALGTQTEYDADLDIPHDRAFAFTDQGWRRADLHQVWDRNWFPRRHPDEDPSVNFAFHMARNIALTDPQRVVGFILVTDPGKKIENWDVDGEFWQSIDTRVIDAINRLPHKSQLDGILWHQGESNAGESDYHVKLHQLIDNFRIQSWFSTDKPFICGETAAYESINQQLMALNTNGDNHTGCVSSNNLTTQEDGFHFDAPALRELGRRYAVKYLALTR